MIASKEKLEDIRWRDQLLGYMQRTLEQYKTTHDKSLVEVAQVFGLLSQEVQKRINSKHYTK